MFAMLSRYKALLDRYVCKLTIHRDFNGKSRCPGRSFSFVSINWSWEKVIFNNKVKNNIGINKCIHLFLFNIRLKKRSFNKGFPNLATLRVRYVWNYLGAYSSPFIFIRYVYYGLLTEKTRRRHLDNRW